MLIRFAIIRYNTNAAFRHFGFKHRVVQYNKFVFIIFPTYATRYNTFSKS